MSERDDVLEEVREWLWARREDQRDDGVYANVMADMIGLFTYHFIGLESPYGQGDGPAFVAKMREKVRADLLAAIMRLDDGIGRLVDTPRRFGTDDGDVIVEVSLTAVNRLRSEVYEMVNGPAASAATNHTPERRTDG